MWGNWRRNADEQGLSAHQPYIFMSPTYPRVCRALHTRGSGQKTRQWEFYGTSEEAFETAAVYLQD